MKAILIARVSTEEQKETRHSLPAQIIRLEKYCQNKNLQILKVCSFDESAYTNQRNEFDQIIDFILVQKEKKIEQQKRDFYNKHHKDIAKEQATLNTMLENLYIDKLKIANMINSTRASGLN